MAFGPGFNSRRLHPKNRSPEHGLAASTASSAGRRALDEAALFNSLDAVDAVGDGEDRLVLEVVGVEGGLVEGLGVLG